MAGLEELHGALGAELAHDVLGRLRDADVVARAAREVHGQVELELPVHRCGRRRGGGRGGRSEGEGGDQIQVRGGHAPTSSLPMRSEAITLNHLSAEPSPPALRQSASIRAWSWREAVSTVTPTRPVQTDRLASLVTNDPSGALLPALSHGSSFPDGARMVFQRSASDVYQRLRRASS